MTSSTKTQTAEDVKSSISSKEVKRNLDSAYWFIEQSKDITTEAANVDLASVRQKVDWRIVPMMLLCYTVAFVDKTLLNYAAVMGLNKDLKLEGNAFSNTASAFYLAYLIAEVPNGYFLQMVSPRKWLAGNVVIWGIATACTAAAQGYHSLLAARIFLGIFEATIAPSQIMITAQWYTKSEQVRRTNMWVAGIGLGQVIGGFMSWAFQQAENSTFDSWRIMFVVLGVVTMLSGILTYCVIPDNPMSCNFLTRVEKLALLKHVSVNQTGIKNRRFKASHLREIVMDPQAWMFVVITILAAIPTGVVSLYSATLLKNAGYTPQLAALLSIPQGLAGIISSSVLAYAILHTSNRWAWIITLCCFGILGGGLISFLPISNHAGLLAGLYLVSALTPTQILIMQWAAANVAGQTKRSIVIALIAASFSAGSVIAPQTFQAKDAPEYLPAKETLLASQVAEALLAGVLFGYYVWNNRRRDGKSKGGEVQGVEGVEQNLWEDVTDLRNPAFRYVY